MLTKKQKKPLAKLFNSLNTSNNGHLSKEELTAGFLKYFGNVIEREEIEKIFQILDASGSNAIEFSGKSSTLIIIPKQR